MIYRKNSLLLVIPLLALAFHFFSQINFAYAQEDESETTLVITVRKTYSVAGQLVAQRSYERPIGSSRLHSNGTQERLHVIYTDHLGSANTLVDQNGDRTDTRFLPFGELRGGGTWEDGVGGLTERGFTGHQENRDIGLTYMNARYYVPGIGKFASADIVVPNAMDPQSYNRFSYVYNNPIRLIDPSGHCGLDTIDDNGMAIKDPSLLARCEDVRNSFQEKHNIEISGKYFFEEMLQIIAGLNAVHKWSGEPLDNFMNGIYVADRNNTSEYEGCYNTASGPCGIVDPQALRTDEAGWIGLRGQWESASGFGLKNLIIHEAAHGIAIHRPQYVTAFSEKMGWGDNLESAPSGASPYSRYKFDQNHPLAHEEDFADHVARALSPIYFRNKNGLGTPNKDIWYYQTGPIDALILNLPSN